MELGHRRKNTWIFRRSFVAPTTSQEATSKIKPKLFGKGVEKPVNFNPKFYFI